MAELKENVIEWYNGDDTILCTLNQAEYINKVKRIKERYPNDVKIVFNNDGSIFAKLQLKTLKLTLITRENTPFSHKHDEVGEYE